MVKIIGYAIRSTSDEGVYYLVNGWYKHNALWVKETQINKAIFKTIGNAKCSLTKLLKVMPDYKTDLFEYIAITESGEFSLIPHYIV